MRVAVIDVGANTSRLLVADVLNGVTRTVCETRAPIRLGDEIERRGTISDAKLDEVASAVSDAVATARAVGVDDIAVLVTSPGSRARTARSLLARSCVRPEFARGC